MKITPLRLIISNIALCINMLSSEAKAAENIKGALKAGGQLVGGYNTTQNTISVFRNGYDGFVKQPKTDDETRQMAAGRFGAVQAAISIVPTPLTRLAAAAAGVVTKPFGVVGGELAVQKRSTDEMILATENPTSQEALDAAMRNGSVSTSHGRNLHDLQSDSIKDFIEDSKKNKSFLMSILDKSADYLNDRFRKKQTEFENSKIYSTNEQVSKPISSRDRSAVDYIDKWFSDYKGSIPKWGPGESTERPTVRQNGSGTVPLNHCNEPYHVYVQRYLSQGKQPPARYDCPGG